MGRKAFGKAVYNWLEPNSETPGERDRNNCLTPKAALNEKKENSYKKKTILQSVFTFNAFFKKKKLAY